MDASFFRVFRSITDFVQITTSHGTRHLRLEDSEKFTDSPACETEHAGVGGTDCVAIDHRQFPIKFKDTCGDFRNHGLQSNAVPGCSRLFKAVQGFCNNS